MTYFWRHRELFDLMTFFDVMTYFLTLSRTYWSHDILLTSWRTFDVMTSWRNFDIMTNFLNEWLIFTLWQLFYVMTYFWRHDELFDVMMYFVSELFLHSLFILSMLYNQDWHDCFILQLENVFILNRCSVDNWCHIGVGLVAQLYFLSDALVLLSTAGVLGMRICV